MSAEQQARQHIDRLLAAADWHVCDVKQATIHAATGVGIREFPLLDHGFADYLLYVDGKAAGAIEAKKEGVTLTGVETQAAKYTAGLPQDLPARTRPLPFAYQSTGVETRFTNGLDPESRSRPAFAFPRKETLRIWLAHALPSSPRGRRRRQGGGTSRRGGPRYRLIKFAGARRELFLADHGNLGQQTKKEFDQYCPSAMSWPRR